MIKKISIHPRETESIAQLDPIETIAAPATVSSALHFFGEIDPDRFSTALEILSDSFPSLFYTLYQGANGIETRNSEFALEIEELLDQEYINSSNANLYLPHDVSEKMLRPDLAFASIDGLATSAFKLTVLKGSFVVGYRLGHAFFDQSSIVYLMRCLANIYSKGELTLPKPAYRSRGSLIDRSNSVFSNLQEFEAATPKGFTGSFPSDLKFLPPIETSIIFDIKELQNIKDQAGCHVSSNDILNAILLKSLLSNVSSASLSDQQLRILFARNMRKNCGFSEDVVGDIMRLEVLELSALEVQGASIVDLALASRKVVDSNPSEQFKQECHWFMDRPKFSEGPRPGVDYLQGSLDCVVTNWSSFGYEEIAFDDARPHTLLLNSEPAMTTTGAFTRISFKNDGKTRQLSIVIASTYPNVIASIKQLSQETGLYSINDSAAVRESTPSEKLAPSTTAADEGSSRYNPSRMFASEDKGSQAAEARENSRSCGLSL